MQKLGNLTLYSTDDCKKLFKMSNKSVLRLFHRPDFPSIRFGRSFWIEEKNLLEYLGTHRDLLIDEKEDIEFVPLHLQ